MEAHLARIERLNPGLNAFITITAREARAAAGQAESEIGRGHYRGPLHGVPIGLKDIFDTAGVLTTHGSSFYRDNVAHGDEDEDHLSPRGVPLVTVDCLQLVAGGPPIKRSDDRDCLPTNDAGRERVGRGPLDPGCGSDHTSQSVLSSGVNDVSSQEG